MNERDIVPELHDAALELNAEGWLANSEVCRRAATEIERLRNYSERLIERLGRCPDETRAIDADIKGKRLEAAKEDRHVRE